MLEDHVAPFIKQWGMGLGTYGEQGGESIHPEFNRLYDMFGRMKPNRNRLFSMLKEHFLRVHPEPKKMRPIIQKRKWKTEE